MTDLKRIVVLASGEAGDSEALNAAAAIAALHRAVVEIFSIHQDAAGDLISLGLLLGAHRSAETLNAIAAAEKESRDRIAEAAIRCAEAHDLPYGPGPDSPRLVLFDHAFRPPTIEDRTLVLADLTVIGQGYLSKAGSSERSPRPGASDPAGSSSDRPGKRRASGSVCSHRLGREPGGGSRGPNGSGASERGFKCRHTAVPAGISGRSADP